MSRRKLAKLGAFTPCSATKSAMSSPTRCIFRFNILLESLTVVLVDAVAPSESLVAVLFRLIGPSSSSTLPFVLLLGMLLAVALSFHIYTEREREVWVVVK